MAFASTIREETVMGNLRVQMGTYSQASGDTGGAIKTGLTDVYHFQATGATKATNAAGTVTIVTADPAADVTGFWLAMGY